MASAKDSWFPVEALLSSISTGTTPIHGPCSLVSSSPFPPLTCVSSSRTCGRMTNWTFEPRVNYFQNPLKNDMKIQALFWNHWVQWHQSNWKQSLHFQNTRTLNRSSSKIRHKKASLVCPVFLENLVWFQSYWATWHGSYCKWLLLEKKNLEFSEKKKKIQ